MRRPTRGPAKFSAAKAPPMSPARVMATWIVARNRAGCSVKAVSFFARLSPSWVMRFNFASFMEITAISALANTAFPKIKRICNRIAPIMVLCNFSPFMGT